MEMYVTNNVYRTQAINIYENVHNVVEFCV